MSRKSKQINVIFEQETCDKVNPIMSVMQQEDISLFSESSECEHLSEFEVWLVIQAIMTKKLP